MMNTYELKRTLFRRITIEGGGFGAMHWPLLLDKDGNRATDEFPPDYWPQFKNERLEVRPLNSASTEFEEVYVKLGPNEAIDLEVMSLAALEHCGADVKASLGRFAEKIAERATAFQMGIEAPIDAPPQRVTSGGFHRPRG